jgi:hypothetical protein
MIAITITREAVCAADDQTNPLTLTLEAAETETLEVFIGRIMSSRFLQFSSSHPVVTGFASDRPIVEVHADNSGRNRAEFLIPADTAIGDCLPSHRFAFMWAANHSVSSTIHRPA